MKQILWTLPFPSTALLRSPQFRVLGNRSCSLVLAFERDGTDTEVSITFSGVEFFQCTYGASRTSEMMTSYDRLVSVVDSDKLANIKAHLRHHHAHADPKHLMINFDDGPCYELICRSFTIE